MTNGVNIVVPIKGLREGKSRLRGLLTNKERYALNRYLSNKILSVLATINRDFTCYVISRDEELEAAARKSGAEFMLQRSIGLNNALREASRVIPNYRTIYIASDLPNLRYSDLEALADVVGIGIAPDKTSTGTNAISLPTPVSVPFCFGHDSFSRHCDEARKLNTNLIIVRRPGLEFDIDTNHELRRWKGWPLQNIKRRV